MNELFQREDVVLAHSFHPPKYSDLSNHFSVFWFMLPFHCILTLENDLYQRENQVFKPTSSLVLLHCGVEKTGPAHPPPNCFDFFLSFCLLDYATLSLYLYTYE